MPRSLTDHRAGSNCPGPLRVNLLTERGFGITRAVAASSSVRHAKRPLLPVSPPLFSQEPPRNLLVRMAQSAFLIFADWLWAAARRSARMLTGPYRISARDDETAAQIWRSILESMASLLQFSSN